LPFTPRYLAVGFSGTVRPPPTLKLNNWSSESSAYKGNSRAHPRNQMKAEIVLDIHLLAS
jgi:hypothetical protein